MTLIVGLLATKDAGGVFAALRGSAHTVIATGFASDKAARPEALAAAAADAGVEARCCPTVKDGAGRRPVRAGRAAARDRRRFALHGGRGAGAQPRDLAGLAHSETEALRHAAKMAARLQAADPPPLALLRVDLDGGHRNRRLLQEQRRPGFRRRLAFFDTTLNPLEIRLFAAEARTARAQARRGFTSLRATDRRAHQTAAARGGSAAALKGATLIWPARSRAWAMS